MVSNMISRAAVLSAALVSTVSAGKAIIQNQCSFPVYLSSVSNVAGPMQELAANGGSYSETYRSNPNGGGISIKLASDKSFSSITQFEYTLEDPELWYDLSNINGYPFKNWGVSIIPADKSCNEVICPAGVALCAAAYNTPTEDWATAMCYSASDMVVLLCSGAKDSSDTSPSALTSTVAATSVKASSTKVTSVAPTTTSVKASSTSVASLSLAPISVGPILAAVSTSVAPVTSTTAAPVTTSAAVVDDSNNGVVIQTTFVTQVVTVVAGDDTPVATETPVATTTEEDRPRWTGRPRFTGFARRHEHHAHRHGAQQ